MGTVFGAATDVALDDPRLDDFATALEKDSSAVVLVGKEAMLDDFSSAFDTYGGKVIETNLDENDVKAIRKAMKAAS